MSRNEMNELLATLLPPNASRFDKPSTSDWAWLEAKFGCEFGDDFRYFIEFMTDYEFPGDIFNVSTGRTNGNDPIALVYDTEMRSEAWNPEMIPFYGIGNGDYFCIKANEYPASPVYYFYAEQPAFRKYCASFEAWVRRLPEFLKSA